MQFSDSLIHATDRKSSVVEASIGLFYLALTRYLGLGLFGEYKLMGLAPHGNPLRYAELFDRFTEGSVDGRSGCAPSAGRHGISSLPGEEQRC